MEKHLRSSIFKLLLVSLLAGVSAKSLAADPLQPNIVFILADDLGWGDVHCLNPERCKIATPNLDRLAAQGMTFTDAHSTSAVCSPSRYGILTGRYNWRSQLQAGIVIYYGKPLISHTRLTVAGLLKEQGYVTGCIGKWHLGWNWPKQGEQIDFTQPIKDGPTTLGFDYYFGTDVPNWPPYCFIENNHTIGLPTVPLPKDLLGNGRASQSGLAVPGWKLEAILPTVTDKACDFITSRTKAGQPFFLYFSMPSPHVPLAPSKDWQGKSGLGPYGDYVMETDWAIGKVLAALDQSGVASNTVVLLASDNGAAPYVGVGPEQLKQLKAQGFPAAGEKIGQTQRYKELEALGQFSSAAFRGHKTDIWEGGHRIPFIVRWPGKVQAGSTSDQLVSLVDFMATSADIVQAKIPNNAAEDSVSLLPVLLGQTAAPIHKAVVFHSGNGCFAIQEGHWKLELCPGSGGWGEPKDNSKEAQNLPPEQLYDVATDIGEQTNVCASHPEMVARLTKVLEKYVANGRSTPGPQQQNDVPIKLWKFKPSKASSK